MSADSDSAKVVITVNEGSLATIEAVAEALRGAGMNVENVLSTTGMITGNVPKAHLAKLSGVRGVAAVEPDREMRAI